MMEFTIRFVTIKERKHATKFWEISMVWWLATKRKRIMRRKKWRRAKVQVLNSLDAPEGIKAHVYRRFREAAKDFPNEATPVLEMISGLYKARSENDKGDGKDIIGKLFAYLLSLARRPKSSL